MFLDRRLVLKGVQIDVQAVHCRLHCLCNCTAAEGADLLVQRAAVGLHQSGGLGRNAILSHCLCEPLVL